MDQNENKNAKWPQRETGEQQKEKSTATEWLQKHPKQLENTQKNIQTDKEIKLMNIKRYKIIRKGI